MTLGSPYGPIEGMLVGLVGENTGGRVITAMGASPSI
jgi:hypothetical protein